MADDAGTHAISFRVGSSFALPEVVRSLGHAPEALFAEIGIDPALYGHPENRIAARDLGRLFAGAARITGRTDIALLVVDRFQPRGLGLVGELAAEGPDVRTALRNIVRLLQYNTLAGYPVLSLLDGLATMKFELRDFDFPGASFILEGATGIIFRLMQWLCGPRWKPEAIHLSRRMPADPRPFRRFFAAPVCYSATDDAVLFSADWLARPVPREEQRRAAQRLEIANAPFSELVRRQVAQRLGFAAFRAEDVAQELGISPRQLFRHLAEEGTTYRALADGFRFARARHLLASGDAPLADIAFALGFPEQSAFNRAFARWSGMPPGKWRAARGAAGEGPASAAGTPASGRD
ncbi:MAG: AraC family transcriptional regulator [Dongiaceae bacterium]